MKQTDIAWAAGFFDGEGYIGMHARGLALIIGQRDRNPLNRFVEIFKIGKVTEQKAHYKYKTTDEYRLYYRLDYRGDKALFILRLLLPFLTVKQIQALEAIRQRQSVPNLRLTRRLNNKAQVICQLRQLGYTFNVIGKMLDISRQRAHQLYQSMPEKIRLNNSQLQFFQS